ncbi:cbb3-type cytochrome c oxidase subunit I [Oleiagrimonas sp.]|jgi:nitric oxide reductase subunit B|uniref:nitric-oxide reductase large subunit n=1 Tax=Oleiagrimonas sp. TaxID=2010330 RepID=UPI0026370CC3|nr:cbb3-type cytochrome c oxidase subunit I [Oleiagrimonas sp.]MDA3912889.1 cbb3-type cytochrome c oxidase subunit I [Oleiagrimonas sp.]
MSPTILTSGRAGPQDRISKVLIWILLFVVVACWLGMAAATRSTYQQAAPLPQQMVTNSGTSVMSYADIVAGKSGFQKADLMDYGSLYGMGSAFGEDYTAEYLVQLAKEVRNNLALARYGKSFDALNADQQPSVTNGMRDELHGIDLSKAQVVLPDAVAKAIESLRPRIATSLLTNDFSKGYTGARALDPTSAGQTANFLLYSSLTTVARRPGKDYSWTSNWPSEPLVGNAPTKATFVWTWASFTMVFFAIGAVLVIFRLWIEPKADNETFEPVLNKFMTPTPSQKALWKYFLVVAGVLLVQILAGSIMAHYYTDRVSFYGIDVGKWLPFAFLRSVHLQAPIVWIGVSWIGAGLFLAPMIGKREPSGQKLLVNLIFWVLVTIVAGALIGDYLGIMGLVHTNWFWFGNQGLSYLELGRFWQILFFVGLAVWCLVLLRAFLPTLKTLFRQNGGSLYGLFRIEHLLWISTLTVALFYVFGMIPLTSPNPSFSITDFWRWWVVHLWVELAFELFTAAVTGYFLMALGLVSRQMVERAVLFEWVLIFIGGVLGTGHHLYWAGEPGLWVGVGSMFSFVEVLPLVLLVLEAIDQHRHIRQKRDFPYKLAYLYILGAAFWNFVGAGVFGGGTLNAPLVNYYEHGTFLTLNHAHTSMFGAFGLLAIGLLYMVLRYLNGDRPWNDRAGVWAFWLYNSGVVMWIVLNFYPIGWPQLEAVYTHGYAYARSMQFYNTTTFWQWMRMPGDIVFAAGALLMTWDFIVKLIAQRKSPAVGVTALDGTPTQAGSSS